VGSALTDKPSLKQNKEENPEVKEEEDIDFEEVQDLRTTEQLPEMRDVKGKTLTIEIAAGAILGGLSALVGYIWDATLETIAWGPQFAPGMTWFDIMAVPMLVAFFVFGIRSGLIASVIGCLTIMAFPGEQGIGWLSMWPKFIASTIMFVVPWLILRGMSRRKRKIEFFKEFEYSSAALKNIGVYSFLMAFAILTRLIVMFILNVLIFSPAFMYLLGWRETFIHVFDPNETAFLLGLGGGYAGWNVVQGIADATFSYLIVYPTTLYKRFSTW
jgi:hypothetical protein